MLNQAIPRLVEHLRAMFPDAKIELLIGENMPDHAYEPRPDSAPFRMSFALRNSPEWLVVTETLPLSVYSHQTILIVERGDGAETSPAEVSESLEQEGFQYLESSLLLKFPQIEHISNDAFLKLISFENLGLRGLTLLSGKGTRELIARTGFVAQVGRTLDETENLAIDALSLLRFARILKDRITRSTVDGRFSYEMYQSQYLSVGRGRNRYINYAKCIFKGSTERVFGQMQKLLIGDFAAETTLSNPGTAKIVLPHMSDRKRTIEFSLRVPGALSGEVPMVTCETPIMIHRANGKKVGGPIGMAVLPAMKMMEVAARLNARPEIRTEPGHFEVSADGAFLTYASWKHLTNDLQLFSLDYIVTAIARAEEILKEELQRLNLHHEVRAKVEEPTPSRDDHDTNLAPPPLVTRRAA